MLVLYTWGALFETLARGGGALVSFPHNFMVRTVPHNYVHTYVLYAWHTYALAPFKMAKRVKQVEEKKS